MLSLKFKPAEGSLECPTSLISNKSTDDKCAASVTSRPGSAPTAGVATATCSVVTSTSLTVSKLCCVTEYICMTSVYNQISFLFNYKLCR